MKIYLAASYKRRDEIREYAEKLKLLGHEITSRWLRELSPPKIELTDVSARFLREHAQHDMEDIESAGMLVLFTKNIKERGGMYVEMGYALGLERTIILIGPKRNIFHWLLQVKQFDTFGEFLEDLNGRG